MLQDTAVLTLYHARQGFFKQQYEHSYGHNSNRIDTVSIRPYTVYSTALTSTLAIEQALSQHDLLQQASGNNTQIVSGYTSTPQLQIGRNSSPSG